MERDNLTCCICDEPLRPPHHILGGRAYCDRHFALVNKPHPGFWRAGLVQIVVTGLLSALVALLAGQVGSLEGAALLTAGVVMAIVPSAIWLVFFYRQDRLEPEPKHSVAAVFFLALILADVLGRRMIDDWFHVRLWASASSGTSLAASILIAGVIWQAIAYLAVRLAVYATPEFDERMDGIVYGTVAGLGVATLLNLRYVLDNGGVALGPGVINVVTTALAQASFGGLMGYFMAEAKFTHRPAWWVPLGFALAAALNGLFSWLIGEVSAAGLGVEYWRSLLLGLAVALAAFFTLVALMRRSTEVTLRQTGRPS
ncbi:PrsW family intramembrane metalloprotease [Oscillochloris sp. ZM17-4]|uniref:PrsW family intramembrane metalloprotease n=1 Tax=Oscillochloris sp. ZM17-4 TaxID=2866714 RepID=UPI001C738FAC|nr:PrsW family glutamic-type intramembrane protease [Oscillochloris sp. ZM17-4]MBX0328484.1 PrsW family intramembrane metalloprotease [Oscillochloris sp. ZM17-4]